MGGLCTCLVNKSRDNYSTILHDPASVERNINMRMVSNIKNEKQTPNSDKNSQKVTSFVSNISRLESELCKSIPLNKSVSQYSICTLKESVSRHQKTNTNDIMRSKYQASLSEVPEIEEYKMDESDISTFSNLSSYRSEKSSLRKEEWSKNNLLLNDTCQIYENEEVGERKANIISLMNVNDDA